MVGQEGDLVTNITGTQYVYGGNEEEISQHLLSLFTGVKFS